MRPPSSSRREKAASTQRGVAEGLAPLRLPRTHSEFESRMKDFLPHYLQSFALPCATLSSMPLLSLGTFRREPAKRGFDESFAPIQNSEE